MQNLWDYLVQGCVCRRPTPMAVPATEAAPVPAPAASPAATPAAASPAAATQIEILAPEILTTGNEHDEPRQDLPSELANALLMSNDNKIDSILETYALANSIHEQTKHSGAAPEPAPAAPRYDDPANFNNLPKADVMSRLSTAEFDTLVHDLYKTAELNVKKYQLNLVDNISEDVAIEREANRLLAEYKCQK